MSPFCPTLGVEYPIQYLVDQAFDLDSVFLPYLSLPQDCDGQEYDNNVIKRSDESAQGTSSTDDYDNPILAKKLSHNASERDRRKKINDMYASLRALLPAVHQRKKLSIPRTVGLVLEYIPELQKEVEDLNHKKEVIVSKISALQGNAWDFIKGKKPNKSLIKETSSFLISSNKLCDKEMVIQISTVQRMSIYEVLMLLEMNGYLVIHVSSFQSFGGRTFYNIHLWIEGKCNVNLERGLSLLLEKQKQMFAHVVHS